MPWLVDSALHRPPVHHSSLPCTSFLPTAQGSQGLPPALLAPPCSPSAISPARHHLCTPAHRPEPPAPDLSSQLRHLPQMWALSTRSTCPREKARRPPEPHTTCPFPELPRLARAPIHPQVCSPLALPGATSITQFSPGAHGTCSDPRTPLKAVGTRTRPGSRALLPPPPSALLCPPPPAPLPRPWQVLLLGHPLPFLLCPAPGPSFRPQPNCPELGALSPTPPSGRHPSTSGLAPALALAAPGRTVTLCGCDVLSPRGRPSTRLPFQAQLSPGQWQGAINYLQDT